MADYTTVALVEAELRASTIFSTSTLPTLAQVGVWITESSAQIDSVSNELFSSVVVSSEYVDYDGNGVLEIPAFPIISVSQVRYNQNSYTNSTEDWITLTEGNGEHYLVYEDYGEIEFIGGNSNATPLTPKSGKKRLLLSYSKGRTTTPLDIQRWATLDVSKRVINTLVNSQSNTEGGEVTVGPITVKDPTSFSLGQINSMDREIASIKADVGQNFTTFRSSRRY